MLVAQAARSEVQVAMANNDIPKSFSPIAAPYHTGILNHRVGAGPPRILASGLPDRLNSLGFTFTFKEIDPVDDFEGEIGVAAGMSSRTQDSELVWFDAHSDLDSPDETISGYFDGMSVSMLTGESWRALMATVPEHQPVPLNRGIFCGFAIYPMGRKESSRNHQLESSTVIPLST